MTSQKTAKVGQNLGQSTGKTGGKSSNPTTRIKRLTKNRIEKGDKNMMLQTRPQPVVIDLNSLSHKMVDPRVMARGVALKGKGRVHQNSLYPWRFTVSGDDTPNGTSAYLVDLSTHSCSCLYFLNTDNTCKHLVAALLTHMEWVIG